MRLFIFSLALMFVRAAVGQVDLGLPELDSAILQSKQFQRMVDRGARRNTGGINGDLLRWQKWQELTVATKAPMTPWQNYGPDTSSGRIISIAFHPDDSNTFLVGAASGGLWITNDYGANYECLTDAYFTMGVGAIAYNPQNPNSILIVTGEGYGAGGEMSGGFGVLISFDAGVTWSATALVATLDQSFAGMDIYWNPVDTTKVAIASSFGMYYSVDGGLNYSYTLDRIGGRMIADPVDADRLYFSAKYYTATYPGGLYVSTNSGASWSLTGTGLPIPDEIGYSSLCVHPVYNNIIFMSISESPVTGSGPLNGLYRSNDFGATFSQVFSTTDYLCYPSPYDYICLGWYANTICISPSDTNTLFAGGPRLWKSADGGVNWETIDDDVSETIYIVHPDHHQTLFHPITGDLFDCNDSGVDFSSDSGATWVSASEGLITHQFYSIASAKTDPEVVIGGTQDVGTFTCKTAHTGGWDNDYEGDGFGHLISHNDADVWYGTQFMSYKRIRSNNAGATWYEINTGTTVDQWRMPIAMHPENSNTLLSSDDENLYKTVNGGATWSVVSLEGMIGAIEYDLINPDLILASSLIGGTIYRSTNGGNSWLILPASPGSPVNDICVDPSNSGTIYACIGSSGPDEQMFVSYDAGATWNNISNDLPEVPVNSIAVSTMNSLEVYVGNDLGVWVTLDGGTTWQSFNDGLPAAVIVEDMHFYEGDGSVRIGTYGRGYWKTDSYSNLTAEMNDNSIRPLTVFPNPTDDKCWISLPVSEFTILDIFGRAVMQGSGIELDLSSLEAGVYFLATGNTRIRLIRN